MSELRRDRGERPVLQPLRRAAACATSRQAAGEELSRGFALVVTEAAGASRHAGLVLRQDERGRRDLAPGGAALARRPATVAAGRAKREKWGVGAVGSANGGAHGRTRHAARLYAAQVYATPAARLRRVPRNESTRRMDHVGEAGDAASAGSTVSL